MAFYTDIFSPETYQAFERSTRDISGFRESEQAAASKLVPGDNLVCYMTKLSRWFGLLEVLSKPFVERTPIFYAADDPFVVRFRVRPVVWLPKDKAVPIHESQVWNSLSFTRDCAQGSGQWTGKLRRSLRQLSDEDGLFLQGLLTEQASGGNTYPVDEDEFRKLTTQRIRRDDKVVSVTVPKDDEAEPSEAGAEPVRESCRMQALLAKCGAAMGFKIWIPKADRSKVLQEWQPIEGSLLDTLPLNYDETTLDTIEQIDVIWMRGRSIFRAFEVEHTTAVYSGILRMADLLALQPNMDIKLHIVAPESRKEKVFDEIRRPVFTLLERMPLAERCTFISYDSLKELTAQQHLAHLSDSVLDEYAEHAD